MVYAVRPFYSLPPIRLTPHQSPSVAMDPTNPPAYAPTSATRSASVIEHSWNKRPNYVRLYVSFPSFPETLSLRHIFRVRKFAHHTSLSPRKKRIVSRQSSPPPKGKSPRILMSSFVSGVRTRPLSCVQHISPHPIQRSSIELNPYPLLPWRRGNRPVTIFPLYCRSFRDPRHQPCSNPSSHIPNFLNLSSFFTGARDRGSMLSKTSFPTSGQIITPTTRTWQFSRQSVDGSRSQVYLTLTM